ncbi:GTP pyrophosphokinase [Thermosulfidibacter takaii ABI70S6]|uniref:GTP pyrophosphokinase n=1 Tax=Thermosulfidibacter takaii (strain DSM 17441 / JCM 13301 / NBRC 103674 / ABI70S6) TaxID=1298851 RepID=A0A0S3QU38_THET7|nr:bifunctional (p)ppGpp synthetase/guanosine-3',5'-bis(diphosphate) 3'-pyrophosphohydrolase [Thermosulfidibacter takaii]BAT71831.1 GTP pyrophosphokinase [Thermosulfidibacter takaii ABI70S6]
MVTTVINNKLEKIKANVKANHPDADVTLLDRAFERANQAHQGQKRLSGEPYIVHPLEVALILSEMRMDPITVAAALLHDVLEDTEITKKELEKEFGEEITFLVESVSKISKIEAKTHIQRQAETIRKMLLAMAKDLRVIIIKLADRLHNMRTLHFIDNPEKRKRIARETLDIYAPLAHRLGLARIKWEMEDLAFREINPEMYKYIEERVAKSREEREQYINMMIELVREKLKEKGINAHIEGRPKHFYSIYKKMLENNLSFEELYDLIALRIIVDTVDQCYTVLGVIHSNWPYIPGRFKDYIAMPKPNMYQSLHTTVIGPGGEKVEFQIRTWEMHRVAEEGIAAHWKYKEKGRVDKEEEQIFSWIRRFLDWQKDVGGHKDFIYSLKTDLFPEKVYVFTPKGEVKAFPKGATPLDFAYAIHTEVGHHCVGAKVDGRLVSLDYELKTGEKVEILTSPNQHPSRDWLKIVKTTRARTKILAWLRAQEREKAQELGKELCIKEFRKHGENFSKLLDEGKIDEISPQLGYKSSTDLLVAVGLGKLSARTVYSKLFPAKIPGKKPFQEKECKPKGGIKVSVDGMCNVLVRFAKCCNPLPGDDIIGYITKGKGITVHAADCPNLAKLDLDPDRRVDVEWMDLGHTTLPARIRLEAYDKPGLLAEVTSIISKEGINIESANITTTVDKRAFLNFVIDVKSRDQLENVLAKIQQVEGVIRAERVKK